MKRIQLHKHQTYNRAPQDEARFEFSDPEMLDSAGYAIGGLLTISRWLHEGVGWWLRVSLHRLDERVKVDVPINHLPPIYAVFLVEENGDRRCILRTFNPILAGQRMQAWNDGLHMRNSKRYCVKEVIGGEGCYNDNEEVYVMTALSGEH